MLSSAAPPLPVGPVQGPLSGLILPRAGQRIGPVLPLAAALQPSTNRCTCPRCLAPHLHLQLLSPAQTVATNRPRSHLSLAGPSDSISCSCSPFFPRPLFPWLSTSIRSLFGPCPSPDDYRDRLCDAPSPSAVDDDLHSFLQNSAPTFLPSHISVSLRRAPRLSPSPHEPNPLLPPARTSVRPRSQNKRC
jgi:hypothetical protein